MEELTAKKPDSAADLQEETIRLYCNGIEERIRDAASAEDAHRIAGEACSSFAQVCLSSLLKESLQSYVDGLTRKYWSRA